MSIAEQVLDLATPTKAEHTGGMVALVPDDASARRLYVFGGEALDQLHVTLLFLGDDITGWAEAFRDDLTAAVAGVLASYPRRPIVARAFAHTTFNADGGPDGERDPCAVYGIGDSTVLGPLQRDIAAALDRVAGPDTGGVIPGQFAPWTPHLTAGYGMTGADLTYLGPVTFDRVAVVFAGQWRHTGLGR